MPTKRNGSAQDLRELMEKLGKERKDHLDAAEAINLALGEIRTQAQELLGEPTRGKKTTHDLSPIIRRAKTGKRRGRKGAGTQMMLEILRENNGEMKSGSLVKAAEAKGYKSGHSGIQSLRNSGQIKLEDGTCILVE